MNKNKWITIAIILILIVMIVYVSRDRQSVSDDVRDKGPDYGASSVRVDFLTVNGRADDVMFLNLDQELIIEAALANEDQENEAQITMFVKKDGESLDDKHNWTYNLGPGETKEIKIINEGHEDRHGGIFTIEIGDRVIEVVAALDSIEYPPQECFVVGCNSELCDRDPEAASSCEYLPGAACLQEEGVACQLIRGECQWVLSEVAAVCFLEAEAEYGIRATETRIKHLFEKARAF